MKQNLINETEKEKRGGKKEPQKKIIVREN